MHENRDGSFPPIKGVDTAKGITMTGGTDEAYCQVLSMFRKDSEERLQKFRYYIYEGLNNGTGKLPEKHLQAFTTQIQALKGASATIGAAEVYAEATRLETAGKDRDLAFIYDKLPDFVEHLSELVKDIRETIELKQGQNSGEGGKRKSFLQIFSRKKPDKTLETATGLAEYLPIFQELKNALKSQNVSDIEHIMDELNQKPMDTKTKKTVEQISDQVLMTEFDIAIKTIDDSIEELEKSIETT